MKGVVNFFDKVIVMAKKDFLIWRSYRLACGITIFTIVGSLFLGYFLSQFDDKRYLYELILKSRYGITYFPFFLVGMSFSHYSIIALYSFARSLRREQMMGTLEALFVTPTSPATIIFSMSISHFIGTSVIVLVYFITGGLLFNVDLSQINLISLFVIFFLTFIAFSGIGILSASFIMFFKYGDPINFFLGIFLSVFGGSFFPLDTAHPYIKTISSFLPSAYSLRAIRYALFKGYTLTMLWQEIAYLIFFSIFFISLGLACFNLAVRKAKKAGNLTHY